MHPDRVIVRTYIRSEVLSTRQDDQNTPTHQCADTNDAPREPLHGPVTWNPAQTLPYSTLRLRLRLHLRLRLQPCASLPPSWSPQALQCCANRPLAVTSAFRRYPCHWHQQFCWSQFSTGFDSRFSIWLCLIWVLIWLDSIVVSIWLDSLVYFNSI